MQQKPRISATWHVVKTVNLVNVVSPANLAERQSRQEEGRARGECGAPLTRRWDRARQVRRNLNGALLMFNALMR
jgi:hypothetical protein